MPTEFMKQGRGEWYGYGQPEKKAQIEIVYTTIRQHLNRRVSTCQLRFKPKIHTVPFTLPKTLAKFKFLGFGSVPGNRFELDNQEPD